MPNNDDPRDPGGILSQRGKELLRTRDERLFHKSQEQYDAERRTAMTVSDYVDASAKAALNMKKTQKEREDDQAIILAQFQASQHQDRISASEAEKKRRANVNKQFFGDVEREMGETRVASQISRRSKSTASFGQSLRIARTQSTSSIEAQQEQLRGRLADQKSKVQASYANLNEYEEGSPESNAALQDYLQTFTEHEQTVQQLGNLEGGARTQRKAGLDTQSRFYASKDIAGKAQKASDVYRIQGEVASGKHKQKDTAEELAKVTEKLIEKFKELDEATEKELDSKDRLQGEADKLQEEFSELTNISKEIGRQGGGGGGMDALLQGVNALGVGIQGGAQMYRYQQTTSELAQTQQRIGLADLSNSRFFDELAAAGGDASALRRVGTNTFGRQLGRGEDFRAKEEAALGAELTGKTMQSAGSIAGGAMAGMATGAAVGSFIPAIGTAIGAGIGGILGGVGVGTSDMVQTHKMGVDQFKDIAEMQTGLAAANQLREYEDVVNAVSDTARQQGIDTLMGVGQATRGLGGGLGRAGEDREALARLLSDPQSQAKLAASGMGDVGEQIKILNQGISVLGKQMSGEEGLTTMMRGGQLSRSGYFQDPSQYVAARGALTGVSADSDKDLERILRNAVATGMDSSKHIMEMVSATKSLAAGPAGMGFATGAAAGDALSRAKETLLGMGTPKDLATSAAANAATTMEGIATGGGMSISNLIEASEIMTQFPGIEEAEIYGAQKASPQELDKLAKQFEAAGEDPDRLAAARKEAAKMGYNFLKNADDVKRLQGIAGKQQMGDLLGHVVSPEMQQKLQQYRKDELTPEEILEKDPAAYSVGQALSKTRYGVNFGAASAAADYGRKPREGRVEGIGPIEGATGAMERMLRSKGTAQSELFKSITAGEDFDMLDFTEATAGLMEHTAENIDPKKAGKRSKDAAENMEFTANQFSEHMSEFNSSIVRFTDGMNEITKIIKEASGNEKLSKFTQEMGTITTKLENINKGSGHSNGLEEAKGRGRKP